ncbi:efflux transporter outer membrane subunit [Kineobactrum salinum]|uniref:Efflux transporter outer membrane subunit n=1 Tax=Kineobactrum salinum TaxID=2708301 RepID=A0A6C0U0D1_9GAMM|nr:efflux transporter outer membrane subunit [Kineobactrum salinum]QIB65562.1 efflux transporter outer membrane subunit [Kineobactrum salinum]
MSWSILNIRERGGSLVRRACLALLLALSGGCTVSAISPQTQEQQLPPNWVQDTAAEPAPAASGWLRQLDSPALDRLVEEAQASNYQLAQQRARVQELRQGVIAAGADRLPALSAAVDGGRQMSLAESGSEVYRESWGASLDLSWELDIWGRLGDQQRSARLRYDSGMAALRQQQLALAAAVATGWFDAIASRNLLALLQRRLDNVSDDLDVLEHGYRRGLNEALDVYLSRNTVADSRASLARQRQLLQQSIADLQLLMARYPDGRELTLDEALPALETATPAGTPAQLLQRRPDIQQAWLDLLAADAGLAAAHKARFPRFTLAGRAGSSSSALHDLVDAGLSSWSLTAGLAQPLFDAGRLKSEQEQARARVLQAEQAYLDTVYSALAEVESRLSAEQTLRQRHEALLESRANADIAYELSFQQYQRGLVSYTTVLEAQRRAFDAQTSTIEAHNEVLANRIALYLALGGDFARPAPATT